ncbi:MAG: helix-turn-helix domain-containing protein [Bariatricus sp.]
MFEGIPFTKVSTNIPLTSGMVTERTLKGPGYSRENLSNAKFSIMGTDDVFPSPLISNYAMEHYFHLQAFSVFHYTEGSFTRRANFHSYLILYTYRGTASVEYQQKTFVMEPGDGIMIDCRLPHYYLAKTNWDVAVLHIDGPNLPHLYADYLETGNLMFHDETTGRFQQLLENILRIYNSPQLQRDLRAGHAIEELLIYLLVLQSNINIQEKDIPDSIQTAISYMEKNYRNDISLDQLSQVVSMSKYHLSKEMKRYTGFSPHAYLLSLRIHQAKQLLHYTDLPANKIALSVGFNDINNFNYQFKKRTGKTPLQYRRSPDPFP